MHKKREEKEKMSDVPADVLRNILLHLPAVVLLRFRAVCKAWRLHVDDPSFARSHTNRLSLPNSSGLNLLIRNHTGAPLYLVDVGSLEFSQNHLQTIDAVLVKNLIRPRIPRIQQLPTTACRGLILITGNRDQIWVIWNPLTREYHQLPPHPDVDVDDGRLLGGNGLGYYSATDDVRVVRINVFRSLGKFRSLIYSVRTGCWRKIHDCPSAPREYQGVFFNGALHWICKDTVLVLDFNTEDYHQLALPESIGSLSSIEMSADGSYLILGDCKYGPASFDVWVMKGYGVEESWVKLFSLSQAPNNLERLVVQNLRIVTYLESKRGVLLQTDRGFLWVDIETGDFKQVRVHGHPFISSSQICPGSLYRLGDNGNAVMGNEDSKKKNRIVSRKGNTRLNFCVQDLNTEACSDPSCLPWTEAGRTGYFTGLSYIHSL